MADRGEAWRGRLRGRREARNVRLAVGHAGGWPGEGRSRPLPMLDADGTMWWVKLPNNPQDAMVPVNEQIVAGCGALSGAFTCEVAVIKVTDALSGDVHGVRVEPGLAHGSRHVGETYNERRLAYRGRDDNARRHVGAYALHDWCWGGDSQWLYALGDEYKAYSHDHGHFFPNGPRWNDDPERVLAHADVPHVLRKEPPDGLDAAEVSRMSKRLDAIGAEDLVDVLSGIPPQWPVSDRQLEIVGRFLELRAPQAARRLLEPAGRP